ncbi:hypothetical protein FNH09_21765 [Streptomyces adustus]|uniref:Uncharacterized protein n=1 Tax=Streptomyces adustus TaxID=1609272 RepID=A0A5N8VG08_9ACTN|nr:hypothetical protein [Streptomyces adustus]
MRGRRWSGAPGSGDPDPGSGDVHHRPGRRARWSQPLFRFRGQTSGGPHRAESYLGMTADPDGADLDNGWGTLVRAVKFRHSAYTPGPHARGYWQVRMASSVC